MGSGGFDPQDTSGSVSPYSWAGWMNANFEINEASIESPEWDQPSPAWGEPIGRLRQEFLIGKLSILTNLKEGNSATAPFYRVHLTGADVFWLAVEALNGKEIGTGDS